MTATADRELLETVEPALARALAIRRWWQAVDRRQAYAHRFDLVRSFNRPDRGFGFFDRVALPGGAVPVMGVVQDMLFDRANAVGARAAAELREYVLKYFLRVSDFRRPEAVPRQTPVRQPDSVVSWCPRESPAPAGFGYTQRFAKVRATGAVHAITGAQQHAIVDLRDLDRLYAWLVLRVRIFDFKLVFRPFGPNLPAISLPLDAVNDLVTSRDFVVCRESPGPGVRSEYGLGYGVLRSVGPPGLLAYGPGHFDVGFQQLTFRLMTDGRTLVRLVFVVNRPTRILNVMLDPVRWAVALADLMTLRAGGRWAGAAQRLLDSAGWPRASVDPLLALIALVNAATGGAAASQLCLSKEQLERDMLVQHFMQHYDMITGALLTWRTVPDWLNERRLPRWVVTGATA